MPSRTDRTGDGPPAADWMATLEAARRRPTLETASDVAVAYVKLKIWEGHLRPGDRVSLASIADAIGASPTPLREAIATLAQQGRVIVQNHRGATIAPFDPDQLLDHYELLGLVYSWAAQRCAERITDADAAQMRSLARAIPSAATDDELFDLVKRSEHVIYRTAGSFSARNAAKTLEGVVPGNIYSYVPAAGVYAREIMPQILETIAARDPEAASALGRALFAIHASLVVEQLVDNGVFPRSS